MRRARARKEAAAADQIEVVRELAALAGPDSKAAAVVLAYEQMLADGLIPVCIITGTTAQVMDIQTYRSIAR